MFARRLLCVAALSLLLASSPLAADAAPADPNVELVTRAGGIVYAVPKSGPLRFKAFDAQGAHFSGQIRLTGTYVYGHTSADPADEMVDEPQLFFRPDDATRAMLPYWQDRGPVSEISFENPETFLRAMVKAEMIASVKQRRVHAVTGQATIWVDDYYATAECDHPEYTVRFLKVDQPPQLVARNAFADQLGCG